MPWSKTAATLQLVKICIGSGVLALPYAFKSCGLTLALAVLLAVALWNCFTSHRLVRCAALLKDLPPGPTDSGTCASTYSALAKAALGRTGVIVVDFSLIATLLGVCVVYQPVCRPRSLARPRPFTNEKPAKWPRDMFLKPWSREAANAT